MIQILIVDDHAVVRQGLKHILSEQPDMTVAGEAESAEELMNVVGTRSWSIIILDFSLPGKSGFDVLKYLRSAYPDIPVLFLSMLPEDQFAVRVLAAGAAGYMTKDTPPEELVKTIRRIAAGGKYISAAVAERIATGVAPGGNHLPHEKLSHREFQVFCKIVAGKRLSVIAAEMFLSVKTVSTYRTRILAKMNMGSTADLVRYAVEHGISEAR